VKRPGTAEREQKPRGRLLRWLRDHGLALTTGALFLTFFAGHATTGYFAHNDDLREHGRPPLPFGDYLRTGRFLESTAENWESEFLEMASYVVLTALLYQRGSSESKKIGKPADVDRDPRLHRDKPDAPWPVRRGGWMLRVYEHSLSIAFLLLFAGAFTLHVIGGTAAHNEEAMEHGERVLSLGEFLFSAEFWFESFQNWQSEFLALLSMVTLSVWLRERGSPESKPVDAAHHDTGD
jgi:uncharacterized protein DUF6766